MIDPKQIPTPEYVLTAEMLVEKANLKFVNEPKHVRALRELVTGALRNAYNDGYADGTRAPTSKPVRWKPAPHECSFASSGMDRGCGGCAGLQIPDDEPRTRESPLRFDSSFAGTIERIVDAVEVHSSGKGIDSNDFRARVGAALREFAAAQALRPNDQERAK